MILTNSLKEAEAVAVGIGNEFLVNKEEAVADNEVFKAYKTSGIENVLDDLSKEYVINSIYYHELKSGNNTYINDRIQAYNKIAEALLGVNYFVITTCNDGLIYYSELDKLKIAAPCGSILRVQKECDCQDEGEYMVMSATDHLEHVYEVLDNMKDNFSIIKMKEIVLKCKSCGREMDFNVHGKENYNESGYMEGWKNYTMWLQRTLNRKFALLELGVNFEVPTVIRWPFEKIAMLNNKAMLYRVNGKFPQFPMEIGDKGISINEDSYEYVMKNF